MQDLLYSLVGAGNPNLGYMSMSSAHFSVGFVHASPVSCGWLWTSSPGLPRPGAVRAWQCTVDETRDENEFHSQSLRCIEKPECCVCHDKKDRSKLMDLSVIE